MTNPNDPLAVLQKEMQRLREEREALKRELDALTASVTDCRAALDAAGAQLGVWQHRQASAGEWSRHFSNVRMTVTPFLFTTSLAVLAFKWDVGEPIFITAASVTWAAGVFLLFIFTYFTHASATTQEHYDSLLPQGPAEKKRWGSHTGWPWNWWRQNWLLDMGLLTGVALTFCFITAIGHWREKASGTKDLPTTRPSAQVRAATSVPAPASLPFARSRTG